MREPSKRENAAGARRPRVNRRRISVRSWSRENNERANNAQHALNLYLDVACDHATAVRMLLEDLRHYCDARKVHFALQNGIADQNYVGQVLELI